VIAAGLLLAALSVGVRSVATEQWPTGPDTLRDIGAAETVRLSLARSLRQKSLLPDPNYRGEVFWYSPLMPAAIAMLATRTGASVNTVATRGAAVWNIAGPLMLYVLVTEWFGSLVGVAALAICLFVVPFPSWQAATYSASLSASSLGEPFFFGALWSWTRRVRASVVSDSHALLTGVLLGLAFLVHPAPAAILALVLVADTAWRTAVSDRALAPQLLRKLTVTGVVALVCAAPGLATIVYYRGAIRNSLPFLWLDPSMLPDRFGLFIAANLSPFQFSAPAVVGLVSLAFVRPFSRVRLLILWAVCATLLFLWAAYSWRVIPIERLQSMTIAPAHHFLIYVHAVECVLGGIGVVAIASVIARYSGQGERLATAITVAVLGWLVLLGFPMYARRDLDLARPVFSPAQTSTIEWIKVNTATTQVFLAPDNAGMSMLGISGRRTVIVDQFFSNPYVDWAERDRARQQMWSALSSGDCDTWQREANRYYVTHLLLVDGMTPAIPDGTCGLARLFSSPPFAV
jgi:hypothetical protein